MQYTGAINEELFELLLVDDGFSVGQKFAQIEKTAKKKFINISDKELYETIQKLKTTDYYSDEKLTDKEFETWQTS